MAQAPQVQTLAQVMSELAPGYEEQEKIVGQQKTAVTQQAAAQRQGLEAQKVQGFNQINNQATGRGMSFSGIPLDEQADYLSTKYLPGVQASYAQENQQKLTLAQQLAQMRTEQRNTAMGIRQTQRSDMNSWNLNERNLAATAEQNRLNREFEASQNAANRAVSSASSAAAQQAPDLGAIDSILKKGVGGTGKYKGVSPTTWSTAKRAWMQQGGDPAWFDTTFSNYLPSGAGKSYGLF